MMVYDFRTSLLFPALAATLMACGGADYTVQGTEDAIGVDGKVSVAEDDHGNADVSIVLEHLPPPGRIANDESARYVVWFIEPDGEPHKAGYLEYTEGDRTGKLDALTTLSRFRLLVTTESGPQSESPQGTVVARQDIKR